MKIALIVYQFIPEKGGVERYAFNLSRQLVDSGHDVHVFAHRYYQDAKKIKGLTLHHVPVITLWSPLKYWTFAINTTKVIKKTGINFDIVHGFTKTLYQDIFRVGGGCHWSYMMHTYSLMRYVTGRIVMCLNPRHCSLLFLERIIFEKKLYKQITCISELCKNELLAYYKLQANDIDVIYNAVDIEEFTPLNRFKYRDVVRDRYAVASDDILLLFVGSGFRRKGLKHMIEALSIVNRSKRLKLLVAGKGDIRKYMRYAKEKGVDTDITFLGVCRNIQEIYAAGDIFVFPSEYDPFGTACLEAMATGLPVIVSKSSGASEIITHGKDGFVVEYPVHAEEIAMYITILLDSRIRKQMGTAARLTAEKYSLEANTEKTLSVYRKVLNKFSGSGQAGGDR